jgi:hypothetical protein
MPLQVGRLIWVVGRRLCAVVTTRLQSRSAFFRGAALGHQRRRPPAQNNFEAEVSSFPCARALCHLTCMRTCSLFSFFITSRCSLRDH